MVDADNDNIHERVAELSLEFFNNLPKRCKPSPQEWTVLSTIVQKSPSGMCVVAMGTGSKCIGRSSMSAKGDIINDSHAEVLCRRALLDYFYMEMLQHENSEVFRLKDNKFALQSNITFHFFTTQIPCGDAAIFEMDEPPTKRLKRDINRTGAKCIEGAALQDPLQDGVDYHITAVVRTKPGRGDRTLSVSCSDKIAKWIHLGIQGALLSTLLRHPIFLSSFTLHSNAQFSEDSFNRAMYDRLNNASLDAPYGKHCLDVKQIKKDFVHAKADGKPRVAQSLISNRMYRQVCVDGYKHGTTKKQRGMPSSRLRTCKYELFKLYVNVARMINDNFDANCSYAECKSMAFEYNDNWRKLKCAFGSWPVKDASLNDFKIVD